MSDADRYTLTKVLYEDAAFVVSRGVRKHDGVPVLIKALRAGFTAHEVELLRREYEMGQQLDTPFAVKPIGLETGETRPMLVYPDLGFEPLSLLLDAPLETGRFLELAIRLSTALAGIHRLGFIHKDIRPANVLFHQRTGELKLTGFGLAAPLPRVPASTASSPLCDPAYMSPEQTGRMNRGVDHRSDLYSLGVTFYRMLTGVLPFQGADLQEWVHCHIAREPQPPSRIVPAVPAAIEAIVLKLLAKQPEERYHGARGVQSDLRRCEEQWTSQKRVEPFTPGEHDVPEFFLIPQKLYGRDEQVAALLGAFRRVVSSGRPEFVLVSGYSGIGKSSLVQALSESIVRERGYFVSGKFEQYQREIPFAPVSRAFGELINQLLTESDQRIESWRKRLRQAVGINGRLIVHLIAQVELIIGPQPPPPELSPTEATRRLQLAFQGFVGVFATHEHPLVLFLDDLQWLDQASLKLVAQLITDPDTRHLLLIGAYRDNEVTPSHPLMITLDEIRRKGAQVGEIALGPLAPPDLEQLVADTVHRPAREAAKLAQLVQERTEGNPFFAIQFLSTLYQERLLDFDADSGRWLWDLEAIRRQGATDNVVELMVGKLKRFPAATRRALELAACIGNSAETGILARLCGLSHGELFVSLREAVDEGLLQLDGSYRFMHDRVQEAAYSLIAEEERATLHLRIAKLLLLGLPEQDTDQRVFDVANHFNLAASLITRQEERLRAVELNLRAARKAKASTAYRAAVAYLARAVELLGSDAWEKERDLSFAAHLELAECGFLAGDYPEAERLFPVLLREARTRTEQAAAYRVKIDTHNIKGEGGAAIESALTCLRILGVEMSPHPSSGEVQRAYHEVWAELGSREIASLIDLPPMTDLDMQAAMDILTRLYIPAYYSDNNLFYLHVCLGVNLSLRHGNAPASTYAYGWFGVLLATTFRRSREGYRFARLAHDLVERNQFLAYKALVNMHLKFVAYWSQPLDQEIGYSRAMFEAGVATGDVAAACFSWSETLLGMITRGDPLSEVLEEARRGLDFVRRAGFGDVFRLITGIERFVQAMRGCTRHLSSYDDEQFSETGFESGLDADRMPSLVFYYHAFKLMARFLSGDLEAALASGQKCKALLWAGLFSAETHYFYLYYALTLASLFDRLPESGRKEALETLAVHEKQLGEWARTYPPTFHNNHALVRAEIARIAGNYLEAEQLYEQAIHSARAHGFVQNEGVGNELASRFYRSRGLSSIADMLLGEARACFARWGADGKVRQLDRDYPWLKEEERVRCAGTPSPAVQVDAIALVRASQAISREIVLKNLVDALTRTVLENAGAQKGYLLLGSGDDLAVEAGGFSDAEGIKTVHPAPSEGLELLPQSIVNYVKRTGKSVILDDASASTMFSSDPYLVRSNPVSVMCLPILSQARLVGLLYLENNLVRGAFTADRIAVLEVLAAQAALSLENARIYEALRQAEAKYRSIFENALDGIFQTTPAGRFLDANPAMARMLGYRSPEALMAHVTDITRQLYVQPQQREDFARLLEERDILEGFETQLYREDGSVIWVLANARSVRDSANQPLYYEGIVEDITERKRAEEELRKYREHLEQLVRERTVQLEKANLRLRELDRLKSMFIASMSHELRTPLNSIIGFTIMTLDGSSGELNDEQRDNLDRVYRSSQHLLALITDIMDISRIESGRIQAFPATFSLAGIVDEAVGSVEPQLKEKGLSLETDIPADLSLVTDRKRLLQCLINLLGNAVKFTGKGVISLSSREADGYLELSVRDTGIGISETDLPKLFEPFERLESHLHVKTGGTGLGLYLTRKLATDVLRGAVSVRSKVGEGSTFTLKVPLDLRGALEAKGS